MRQAPNTNARYRLQVTGPALTGLTKLFKDQAQLTLRIFVEGFG